MKMKLIKDITLTKDQLQIFSSFFLMTLFIYSVTLFTSDLIFYQHSACGLELQRPPVYHIPRSEVQIFYETLDLTRGKDVVPHVDIRHHPNKRLIDVKSPAMGILLLYKLQRVGMSTHRIILIHK